MNASKAAALVLTPIVILGMVAWVLFAVMAYPFTLFLKWLDGT